MNTDQWYSWSRAKTSAFSALRWFKHSTQNRFILKYRWAHIIVWNSNTQHQIFRLRNNRFVIPATFSLWAISTSPLRYTYLYIVERGKIMRMAKMKKIKKTMAKYGKCGKIHKLLEKMNVSKSSYTQINFERGKYLPKLFIWKHHHCLVGV